MMDWFEKIKEYYNTKLWDIDRVKDAVGIKITDIQFKEITGEDYVA